MSKRSISILLFFLACSVSYGQMGLSPFTTPDAVQGFRLNPARTTFDKKVYLGLGHINADFYNSAGDIPNAISREGDKLFIDIGSLVGDLEEENTLANTTELMTFYAGTRVNQWRFGLYHSFRLQAASLYPKDLVDLLWFGNGPYVGEQLNVAPGGFYNAWNQIGAHVAYDFGNLQVGVNINRNYGASYGETESGDISVYTNPDFYEITVDNTHQILSSSFFTYEEDYTVNVEENSWRQWAFGRNGGWSLDLGLNFQVNEKLSFHGFLRDLGSITYDEDLHRYAGQGEFKYQGAQLEDGLLDQGIDYDVNLDTILTELDYEEVEAPGEKEVRLQATYGLGADFLLNEKNRFSVILSQYHSSFQDRSFEMFHLGWHGRLFKWMWLNANYSYKFDRHNVGLGLTISPGPFQFMLYTDNLFVVFPNEQGQQTAIFGGMNFTL